MYIYIYIYIYAQYTLVTAKTERTNSYVTFYGRHLYICTTTCIH